MPRNGARRSSSRIRVFIAANHSEVLRQDRAGARLKRARRAGGTSLRGAKGRCGSWIWLWGRSTRIPFAAWAAPGAPLHRPQLQHPLNCTAPPACSCAGPFDAPGGMPTSAAHRVTPWTPWLPPPAPRSRVCRQLAAHAQPSLTPPCSRVPRPKWPVQHLGAAPEGSPALAQPALEIPGPPAALH